VEGTRNFSSDVGSGVSLDTLSLSSMSASSIRTARFDIIASTFRKDGSCGPFSFDRFSLLTHHNTLETKDNHTSLEMSALLRV
jgi:hypothetical protein